MSERNMDVVRRWNDAYNRRDHEALRELTDPDFEFRSIFVAMESVFRGYEGLDAYFKAIEEAYDRFQVVSGEVVDAGAAVLLISRAEWRGKGSGAEGSVPLFVAAWVRFGRVFRVETFTDLDEGMRAVGLAD